MRLLLILPLVALAACSTPRESIKKQRDYSRNACKEDEAIKTSSARIQCEAEKVMWAADVTGFKEDYRVSSYYAEKMKVAQKLDKKLISAEAATKQQAAIDAEYADMFDSADAGGGLLQTPRQVNSMIGGVTTNYLLVK